MDEKKKKRRIGIPRPVPTRLHLVKMQLVKKNGNRLPSLLLVVCCAEQTKLF
jgi:hypothetical protein